MGLWTDPDVRKHVQDRTDYRLSNLFEKLIIYAETDKVGEYVYDTTGESVTKIEVYDVSSTALMEKYYELRNRCETSKMEYSQEYKTPTIADEEYDNVTLGSLILLMNNMYTNADFVVDSSESYKRLPREDVIDLIYKVSYDDANTALEITDAEEYEKILKENTIAKNKLNATIDELASAKGKYAFKDLESNPNYKRLLREFGETKLKKIIKKLTTYNKEV